MAVQIKSGKSYLHEKDDGWRFYVDEAHKNYWRLFPIPVMLLVHNTEDGNIYFLDAKYTLNSTGEIVIPNEWVNDPDKVLREQFVRSPYAVSFRSGDKTFILVTVHIIYGKKSKDRIKEIHGIARWLNDWASDINAYDQNLIVLGDFNIDARGDILDQTFLSEGLYVPEELQTLSRSIFDETKYYDQIAWFNSPEKNRPKLSLEFMGAGNYDFVQTALKNRDLTKQKLSFMISDHYPLWANFRI